MNKLNLKSLAIVRSLDTAEEFDVLKDFLITDPKNVTYMIAFWRSELSNAPESEKSAIEEHIKRLKNHLMNQDNLTMNVYSFNEEESSTVKVEDKKETKSANVKPAAHEVYEASDEKKTINKSDKEDPSVKHLHIVKDNEVIAPDVDRLLNEKYKDYVKKINIESLKLKVSELNAAGNNTEAEEIANFILGKGLYSGKHPKSWAKETIDKWIEACKPKAPEVVVDESDLHVKYAAFIGEHGITVDGLRAEAKFRIKVDKDEVGALELITLLLSEGLYVSSDDKVPFKWSDAMIADFITSLRTEIVPESTEAPVQIVADGTKVEVVKFMTFYDKLLEEVLKENSTEESVKAFARNFVQENKTENFEAFYKAPKLAEGVAEELWEKAYVAMCVGPVAEKFKEKGAKSIDIKVELTKLVKAAMETKEKGLSKVMGEAVKMYTDKGEKVEIKEAKAIVYDILKENYPEYHTELMKVLGEKETTKVTIIQETGDFPTKYPEIWETVKDCKTLDDIYKMAKDLENKQSLTVLSEMITHLISSGKISHSIEKPLIIKWDKAQIELWINASFPVSTPEEITAKTVNETAAEKVEVVPTVNDKAANPTAAVASPETTEAGTGTPAVTAELATVVANKAEVSAGVDNAQDSTVDTGDADIVKTDITYPTGVVVPTEDESLKELYAAKKPGFWQGVSDIMTRLMAKGKKPKEIKHIIADKMLVLSKKDELSQCFVRNFKRTNINELYNVVNKIATSMNVPNWVEV